MNQNQQEQQFGMRESFNLLYAGVKIHAMCFLPIIRRDFGSEALGFRAFYAMVLMLAVGSLWRIPEMFPFLGFWIVMVCYQRGRTQRLVKQGVIWYSRYEGYPWLAMRSPLALTEARAKKLIEPALCLFVGVGLYPLAPGLGVFVMAGFFTLAAVNSIDRELDRKRLMAMRDAEIEQKWLVARYRGQVDE
jgi:hypothetical protein